MDGIKAEREKRRLEGISSCQDPRQSFLDHLNQLGFKPPSVLRIGHMERFASPQDKRHGKAGWAVYHEIEQYGNEGQPIGIGVYGSYNSFPEKDYWTSKSLNLMSDRDRINYNLKIKQAQEQRELEIKINQQAASEKAFKIYSECQNANGDEQYLIKKKILPSAGVKVRYSKFPCGELIIPICSGSKIMSLLYILNDGEYVINGEPIGNKKFLAGGKKAGCYFKIQGDDSKIFISEGYATGKTIHDATGCTVYVCFDSGNIYEIASIAKLENINSKIVICGDDDKYKKDNTGRNKSIQASDGLGIECIFPIFKSEETKPTDFNDLMILEGIDAVKNQLNDNKIELYKAPKNINGIRPNSGQISIENLINPDGVLGNIVNYYNATDGNNQPLFAVQCALSTCSVLLARNFETNYSNRSSLFFMNIAKSGTGKEHAKKIMEKILTACKKDDLISGEGYTSGSGVLSALMEKPRHITVIDEFSKYMQAAQNKNGSSNLMEANSYLMQATSKLDGTIRPKSFSTIGLTNERKKQMQNMRVVNPAITLLAMTTPNDFFQTIDVSAISDGFLNRFVICDSNVERSIRKHKEVIDVPQNIIDWCNKINSRCLTITENSFEEPTLTTLSFSKDAFDIQVKFQEYCIKQANILERFHMEAMTARLNENAMRIALIHALSRDFECEIIEYEDMLWAIEWVKYNYEIVIDRVKMSVSNSEHEGHKKEILKAIRDIGDSGVTWASMQKQTPFSKHKQKDLREILTALVDADLIYEDVNNDGKQGRPSKLYKALA